MMSGALESLLGSEALQCLSGSDAVTHGLPNAAYSSQAFLELEYERLFARNWVFVAFAHEMPSPGDVIPITVCGQPLVLVRNKAGTINAFHNVCRHRGTKIVKEPCHVRSVLTCPYHSWAYDLDGRLKATPYFGGYRRHAVAGFDPDEHGLFPVRCEQWHDWVFINLNGDAPSLDEYVEPLARYLTDIDLGRLTALCKIDFGAVRANWKFLVENFIEPYHVPMVHPRTAAGQPLREHYTMADGHCVGCAVDVAAAPASGQPPESAAPRARNALDMSSRYLLLFPNFVLGAYLPDQVGVHLNIPEGPDRTRQCRVIYHFGENPPDRDTVQGIQELWRKVHEEDHDICERLQEGRASPVMEDGGVLSPHWETSVHQFHKLVIGALR